MSDLVSWSEKLESSTLSVLPFDFVRPEGNKIVEAKYTVDLSTVTQSRLLQLSSEFNVSQFTIGLAAYTVLLFRLTGDEDIVIGTKTNESGKPFVFRSAVTGATEFSDLVESVSKEESFASGHAVPYEDLVQYIQKKQNLQEPPALFKTSFLHPSEDKVPLFGASKGHVTDLTVQFGESIIIHYNSLLFKKERIVIFTEQLVQIISAATRCSTIGKISLITPRQAQVMPEPNTDLHWEKFGGAIHDIFSRNAHNCPDRTCVVETANFLVPNSKDRVFTYKQIDEASNILAHHLVQSGVVIGDVVMVYAYRGVDLVVAVIGVLKAGGTFSVIDPAYPPERQNIYLNVSRPNALVVLRKAGTLDTLVKSFIEKELALKTSIPALEILDDGSLIGGTENGQDILHSATSLKSQGTGVVVGPDCNPTLSFTSGSEGIPKGVKGRHFSLTYYFPWMARVFGLSDKDKFTMLSGIAHDPIQRDIFTPLFLGAQLLVPTADDIGTPGRLAEWMGIHGATITHLTPAMGQLLSAQATHEIPTLHHAFFVGDILTKRDCLRLQSLARNCFIINMYGTTETQRAVSYYEVASLSSDATFLKSEKDVMPAGKGMVDVQLLVVNRNDRKQVCGIGEIGEIYVRAAGLAEEYLKLPDLTAQKFVSNWFADDAKWNQQLADGDRSEPWRKHWLGARDRLYRTGDLGRYRPDGNVECSGRADDQVKIRGFRIELGEIDTHLSQHPMVRENVTLVKRDRNEEAVLISYIVPHQVDFDEKEVEGIEDPIVKGLIVYQQLIKDIKAYLRTKLASYAVPTVIVPLSRMPLNPNGKVDKPKLPFPDTVQLAAVAKKSTDKNGSEKGLVKFTETEMQVRELWLKILPQEPVSIETGDSFFDLGGHSILATQMIFELRRTLALDVPLGLIFKEPTVRGFAKELDKLKKEHGDQIIGQQTDAPSSTSEVDNESEYGKDTDELIRQLPEKYVTLSKPFDNSQPLTVFVTGVTGFLGTFIVRDLLERSGMKIKIMAHVRAKDLESGMARIRSSGIAYGVWKEEYSEHIEPLIGDLEKDQFGLEDGEWQYLVDSIDVVIHNGALVHWVYPYSILRRPNVIGTVNVMSLCLSGKPKYFAFVSSTSAIDTEHYVELADSIIKNGTGVGLAEDDDLEGSRIGLGNGYGQSKWAAEQIIRAAGKRGLRGSIVRPGYVLGDSSSGASSSDDYLLRMVKGCIQLGLSPDINNTVNMVPVDHVARIVTAAAFHPPHDDHLSVVHVTSHPRLRFNDFLGSLSDFGYQVEQTDYITWKIALEKHTTIHNDNALYPLLHFVTDNLPQSSKAPELDDTNAQLALKKDSKWTGVDLSSGASVNTKTVGIYLAYLIAVNFLVGPAQQGKFKLPEVRLDSEVLEKLANVGGRTK